MSQTKYPVLKVRNKNPGTISTGANTEVELDGKKLSTLSFLKLEFHSRRVTKVTMEMYVDVDIEIEPGDATMTIKKVSGLHSILGSLYKNFFNK